MSFRSRDNTQESYFGQNMTCQSHQNETIYSPSKCCIYDSLVTIHLALFCDCTAQFLSQLFGNLNVCFLASQGYNAKNTYFTAFIINYRLLTLKIRPRSPKYKQLFPSYQQCICASFIKICSLVQKIKSGNET